jgi:hypothetical protein
LLGIGNAPGTETELQVGVLENFLHLLSPFFTLLSQGIFVVKPHKMKYLVMYIFFFHFFHYTLSLFDTNVTGDRRGKEYHPDVKEVKEGYFVLHIVDNILSYPQ